MKKSSFLSVIALFAIIALLFTACPQEADPPPDNTYTVTFNSNNGSPVAAITKVVHGSTIEEPEEDPTKYENDFEAWYKDSSFENEWDFDEDTVTANTTLYAKWTPYATVSDGTTTYALSAESNANPTGVTVSTVTRSAVTGITVVKLTGTVTDGITQSSIDNIWGAAKGSNAPTTGKWTWAVIKGIIPANTTANSLMEIKQTNESLLYYKGVVLNDVSSATALPETVPTITNGGDSPGCIFFVGDTAYKWAKYGSGRNPLDYGGFGVLLWSGASDKKAILEITPASETAYTVIVDWSGLTIN